MCTRLSVVWCLQCILFWASKWTVVGYLFKGWKQNSQCSALPIMDTCVPKCVELSVCNKFWLADGLHRHKEQLGHAMDGIVMQSINDWYSFVDIPAKYRFRHISSRYVDYVVCWPHNHQCNYMVLSHLAKQLECCLFRALMKAIIWYCTCTPSMIWNLESTVIFIDPNCAPLHVYDKLHTTWTFLLLITLSEILFAIVTSCACSCSLNLVHSQ